RVTGPVEIVKGVTRVEHIVPEELVDRAADRVCSRFRAHVHDSTCAAPEFSTVVSSVDLELLDGVHAGDDDLPLIVLKSENLRIIVHTIEDKVVLRSPLPLSVKTAFAVEMTEGRQDSGREAS